MMNYPFNQKKSVLFIGLHWVLQKGNRCRICASISEAYFLPIKMPIEGNSNTNMNKIFSGLINGAKNLYYAFIILSVYLSLSDGRL